jgi:hypothetical protein
MIKKAEILAILILILFGMTKATAINVSTLTDKETYLLGEEVVVSVTAYNPDPDPVTLNFFTTLQASYLMDDVYDWSEGRFFNPAFRQRTIEAYGFYTWDLRHTSSHDMIIYPIDVGTHTVVGEVLGYGYSSTVQFEVIPEPATILLLTIGGLFLTRRRR